MLESPHEFIAMIPMNHPPLPRFPHTGIEGDTPLEPIDINRIRLTPKK